MTIAQKVAVGVVAILLFVPLMTNAATADELRVQIEDLLRRIEVLQQQVAAAQQGTTASSAPAPAQLACPRVGATLRRGSQGDDVTRLQQFLALDQTVYPEKLVSGYFGALTETAVARWQTKYNIVSSGSPETTGYGQYGPRTAALMAVKCQEALGGGAESAVGGFLKVSPISGVSPLTVIVEATINTTRSCNVATYTVNYGDGTTVVNFPISAKVCSEQKYTLQHTYQNSGTYVITLSSGGHKTQAVVNVAGTAQSSSSGGSTQATCAGDIAAAQGYAAGKICTQVVTNLLCSYNASYTYSAPNGCQSGFLEARGWKKEGSVSSAQYGGISITADTDDYLTISASFDIGMCKGYELTWGDGDDSTRPTPACTAATIETRKLSHTYPDAGTYTISLKRGEQSDLVDVVILAD